MIQYNITIGVGLDDEKSLASFLQDKFFPALKECAIYSEVKLLKLNQEGPVDSSTYSIQMIFENQGILEQYKTLYEIELDRLLLQQFASKIATFRSEMTLLVVDKI